MRVSADSYMHYLINSSKELNNVTSVSGYFEMPKGIKKLPKEPIIFEDSFESNDTDLEYFNSVVFNNAILEGKSLKEIGNNAVFKKSVHIKNTNIKYFDSEVGNICGLDGNKELSYIGDLLQFSELIIRNSDKLQKIKCNVLKFGEFVNMNSLTYIGNSGYSDILILNNVGVKDLRTDASKVSIYNMYLNSIDENMNLDSLDLSNVSIKELKTNSRVLNINGGEIESISNANYNKIRVIDSSIEKIDCIVSNKVILRNNPNLVSLKLNEFKGDLIIENCPLLRIDKDLEKSNQSHIEL